MKLYAPRAGDHHVTGLTGLRFASVPAADGVLDAAAQLVSSAGLRAYDAVALATAVAARQADGTIDAFACCGRDLRDAAVVHGFAPVPATM